MVIREACPECGSKWDKKNGHTRHGKQHHPGKACERQFVAMADDRRSTDAQRTMIEIFHLPDDDGGAVLLGVTMAIPSGIRPIAAHTHEYDILGEIGSLEADRHRLSPSVSALGHREMISQGTSK